MGKIKVLYAQKCSAIERKVNKVIEDYNPYKIEFKPDSHGVYIFCYYFESDSSNTEPEGK